MQGSVYDIEGRLMFKVVVFICSLHVSPSNCDATTTSVTPLETPEFASELQCYGNETLSWIAKLAIKPEPNKEYAKITCQHIKPKDGD